MAHSLSLILTLWVLWNENILRLFLEGYFMIKYDNMILNFISVAFIIRQSHLVKRYYKKNKTKNQNKTNNNNKQKATNKQETKQNKKLQKTPKDPFHTWKVVTGKQYCY